MGRPIAYIFVCITCVLDNKRKVSNLKGTYVNKSKLSSLRRSLIYSTIAWINDCRICARSGLLSTYLLRIILKLTLVKIWFKKINFQSWLLIETRLRSSSIVSRSLNVMQQILILKKRKKIKFCYWNFHVKFNKRMFLVRTEKRCQQQLNTPKYIYSINIEKEIIKSHPIEILTTWYGKMIGSSVDIAQQCRKWIAHGW